MKTKSLYIHIPFCDHICTYCDFPKVFYRKDISALYIKRLKEELSSIKRISMRTIYIGGGTPSSLSYEQIEDLLSAIDVFVGDKTEEYTIEVNPESVDQEKLKLFKKHGVNRISIGVQTFNDDLLSKIGRKHNKASALKCIQEVYETGFKHVSIDLMYGLPGQKEEDVVNDLEIVKTLPINHLSYYSLILEDHTVLYYKDYEGLDDEEDYAYTYLINKKLNTLGFHRYEISNYAKVGHESLHNKAYWHYDNYYGIGLGATGKIDDELISHSRNLSKYLKGEATLSIQEQSLEETMFNHIMMSLRLTEGLDLDEFYNRYHIHLEDMFKDPYLKHINLNNLVIDGNHLKTTEKSIDYLNDILVDFIPEGPQ